MVQRVYRQIRRVDKDANTIIATAKSQVHPNDEYAREHENGSLGKSEMWYVPDAQKGTEIVYGFRRDMNKGDISRKFKGGYTERRSCLWWGADMERTFRIKIRVTA